MNILKFENYKNEQCILNVDFLQFIRNKFNAKNFIETGTYSGETAYVASHIFDKVYSVELDKRMFEAAKEKFKDIKNTSVYFGSSDEQLNKIIPLIKDEYSIFWLDAHYCGENTAFGKSMTPIKEELEAIKNNNCSNCIIMIDDIRIFGSTINDTEYTICKEYPSIQWINNKLMEINNNFVIYLIGDILLAYDKNKFDINISDIVKSCSISRFYDGKNYTIQQLYDAEIKLIDIDHNDSEYQLIEKLENEKSQPDMTDYHHSLWFALSNFNTNKQSVITILNELKNKHFLIYKYFKINESV